MHHYAGTPDEDFRENIRNVLSFSLGPYLVHLGSTQFSDDWHIVSFKAISAYSIDKRVFDLPVLSPAPLGTKYEHEISAAFLSCVVNAIFSQYDSLKFRNLNWGYWHSLCATPHIAGVHFGAIIEALQRRYSEMHPSAFATKLISDRAVWKAFFEEVNRAVSNLNIPDENRKALSTNIGNLNRKPQRMLMDRLLKSNTSSMPPAEWSILPL